VRAGGASQELLSLAKALAFLGLVAVCFLRPSPFHPEPMAGGLSSEPTALALAGVLALQAVITTYDGWASPVYFAEEFSDPGRDLPRSLIGGVLAVVALYLLINLALLHVLPLRLLAQATLPAADAARALLGPAGGGVITAVALVALLGLINTVVMAAPRILYGLGRDGLLPGFLAGVNGGGTPVAALLITAGGAAALVLAGSFERLLGMVRGPAAGGGGGPAVAAALRTGAGPALPQLGLSAHATAGGGRVTGVPAGGPLERHTQQPAGPDPGGGRLSPAPADARPGAGCRRRRGCPGR